jgi:hypothetical protein
VEDALRAPGQEHPQAVVLLVKEDEDSGLKRRVLDLEIGFLAGPRLGDGTMRSWAGMPGSGAQRPFSTRLRISSGSMDMGRICLPRPAMSFSMSSISLGTPVVRTSQPVWVMSMVSSMRTPKFFSG